MSDADLDVKFKGAVMNGTGEHGQRVKLRYAHPSKPTVRDMLRMVDLLRWTADKIVEEVRR